MVLVWFLRVIAVYFVGKLPGESCDWTMRHQARYMRQRKKDGSKKWFPTNGIIIWRDFALNVKRFAAQLVTMKQSRNPKEFSVENYLVYIPKDRASIDDPVEFSVHCFHVLGEEGKHDTYTAAVNLRKVLDELQRKGLWSEPSDGSVRRVFLQSDGCPKEYKNANAMGLLKKLAQDLNLQIQLDFFGTGNGKGLVDGVGGVFAREYSTDCTKKLGSKARFCAQIAGWIETDLHEFKEATKISRMKVSFRFEGYLLFSILVKDVLKAYINRIAFFLIFVI